MKEDLAKIVTKEKFPLKNESIVDFQNLKESVHAEVVHAKKYCGTQWKRFPLLNEILKGHRSGELTIFTGATGSGKTTFLSEYSLDLCIQGVKTLWGSFEIQNHRLAKMMMSQYSGLNLYKNVELFDYISTQYSKLPLKFMSFHGQETLENVLKTMSNAVVLHDIKHIIIDNLQFMIGTQFPNTMDKFSQQDMIIGAFRRFATNFNCHVTIVIHPRKENSDEYLKISSIFGSAKATQEADNILILQEHKALKEKSSTSFKFVEVCKNRYDGDLGKMIIKFDKDNLCFSTNNKVRHDASQDDILISSLNTDITNLNNNDLMIHNDLNIIKKTKT
ncbi:unnamed protein product [Brachionus calyciflorus]|uniref:SF4 helicase domain-containing protein n=1 Tax=Brachionus calyciflorus TaxID=104777 RepID=A0A814IXR4_9BILA|nr:unnamed protein product [Brachionus calyciflorus]